MITVGERYAMTGYGVGVPKGSDLMEEINEIILQLQDNGRHSLVWLRVKTKLTIKIMEKKLIVTAIKITLYK